MDHAGGNARHFRQQRQGLLCALSNEGTRLAMFFA
jgi:hypothetical protein